MREFVGCGWSKLFAVAFVLGAAACSGSRSSEEAPSATQASPLNANPRIHHFAVYAQNSATLRDRAMVNGGDVGVKNAGTGPFLEPSFELALINGARVETTRNVLGDSVRLTNRAVVGDVQTAQLSLGNPVTFKGPFAFPSSMPALPAALPVNAGTANLSVTAGQTLTVNPGRFATVTVNVNGRLRLQPGRYDFASVQMANDTRIEALGGVDVRVSGRFAGIDRSRVIAASGVQAGSIRFQISGQNGTTGALSATPRAAVFGNDSEMVGLWLVPNGTLMTGQRAVVTGALVARDVYVDIDARVNFQSGFPSPDCVPANCDDQNPCTTDVCNAGTCSHPPKPTGTTCGDANACNGAETCNAVGVCVAGTAVVCPTPDQCHLPGVCDPQTGACSNPQKPDTESCSDGNACTENDVCTAGSCQPGTPVATDDGNPCTQDACDPVNGVNHSPVPTGSSCADTDPCNGNETCDAAGECVPASPLPPPRTPTLCETAACVPGEGWKYTPLPPNTPCADGDACNGLELCDGYGACEAGQAPSLDDGNVCTIDTCDPEAGAAHTAVADDTVCQVGNICAGIPELICKAGVCSEHDGEFLPNDSDGYHYKIYSYGTAPADFGTDSFDDADFLIGGAPFASGPPPGNPGCLIQARRKTDWPLGTEIVVRRQLELPAGARNLTVRVAIDNDVEILVNGTNITGGLQTHEGCADDNQFEFAIPDHLLRVGNNLIAVHGRDRGYEAGLDIAITGEVSVTPGEPLDVDDGNPCTIDSCDPELGAVHQSVQDGTGCGVPAECPSGFQLTQTASVAAGRDAFAELGVPTTIFDWSMFFSPGSHQPGQGGPGRGASSLQVTDDSGSTSSVSGRINLRNWFDGLGFDSANGAASADLAFDGVEDFQLEFGEPLQALGFAIVTGAGNLAGQFDQTGASFDITAFAADGTQVGSGSVALAAGRIDRAWVTITSEQPFQRLVIIETGGRLNRDQYFGAIFAGGCSGFGACSASSVCAAGECVTTENPVENDGNPCTIDSCDPELGPVHVDADDGTSCSDGNACNGAESCVAGVCAAGETPPAIDDGNPCTTDGCDAQTGQPTHTPLPAGASCADANACDGPEACDGLGACVEPTFSGPSGGALARTPWQQNNGEGLVPYGFTSPTYGHDSEYAFSSIPFASDPGWEPAPNGNTIGYYTYSSLCGALGCRDGGEFTYFQTFVDVPAGTVLSAFTISFSGVDDGVRTTVFNSANPEGIVVPGSNVYLGGSGTADPAAYLQAGEVNRVVVTHVDDCCSGSYLNSAVVLLNGTNVETGLVPPWLDDANPCTTDSCTVQDGIVHEPMASGTSCSDADPCNGAELCDGAGSCQAGDPADITDPSCQPACPAPHLCAAPEAVPPTNATHHDDPPAVRLDGPTEVVLRKELGVYANYGEDGAANLLYSGRAATWHFEVPADIDLDDVEGSFFRVSLVADDHYTNPETDYLLSSWINATPAIARCIADLPHGSASASRFNNWVQRDFCVDLARENTVSFAFESLVSGLDWMAIDWIELHLNVPGGEPQNLPPQITSVPLAVATAGTTYEYQVEATDQDLGDALSFSLDESPVGMTIDPISGVIHWSVPATTIPSPQTVTVRATDLGGLFDVQAFTIEVSSEPPQNAPPTVNAGTDWTTLIASIQLQGSRTDDGLPNGTLTSDWSRVSGPGEVSFVDASDPRTSATFSVAGTYELRLTATDGVLTTSDMVFITYEPPAPVNQPPSVNAGGVIAAFANEGVLIQGAYTDDGLPAGGPVTFGWFRGSGPDIPLIDDNSQLALDVLFPTAGTYVLILRVNDGELFTDDAVTVEVAPERNRAPFNVSAGNDSAITLPTNTTTVAGRFQDDGLPLGISVATLWTQTEGPTALIDSPTTLITQITFPSAGSYEFEFTANDSEFSVSDRVRVTVNPDPNTAPTVQVVGNASVAPGQELELDAFVTDDGRPVGAPLTFNWEKVSGPGDVTFSNADDIETFATFSEGGLYVVRLTVSDSALSGSDEHTVTVDDVDAPVVALLTPADDAVITAPTEVTGTVTSIQLDHWTLDLRSVGESAFRPIASGTTPLTNAALGTLDPTLLLNGQYELRLTAIDTAGQTTSISHFLVIEGAFKVGNFTVSFKDLEVPVAGIPIQVIRTYDSRNKQRGDFGVGWTLDIASVRLQKNRVIAEGWETTVESAGPFGILQAYCLVPTKRHYVTVTFADGKLFRWEVRVNAPGGGYNGRRECQLGAPFDQGTVQFVPLAPTTAALERPDGNYTVSVSASWPGTGAQIRTADETDIFDPDQFTVALLDGRKLQVGTSGLEEIRDLNGNTLEIRPNGLFHSAGASIVFARDAQGCITSITDPESETLRYDYNTAGDLAEFTDRGEDSTAYAYDANHYLLGIRDARGIRPIQNEYDAAGRLITTTDALGFQLEYEHQISARTEVVTDRLGNRTIHEYDDRGNVLRTTDPLDHVVKYSYDDRDNLTEECNDLDECRGSTYDDVDNKLTETDPLGNTTQYTYDDRGNVTSATDPLERVTEYTYDGASNLLKTTDPAGGVTEYTHDAQGRQLSVTDALDRTTWSTYDDNGNVLTETDAAGHVTEYTYDPSGNRLSQGTTRTTGAGLEVLVTVFTYDDNGRLRSTVAPDGAVTSTEYDDIGQVIATVDPLGRRTEREYDEMGRLERVIHSDGIDETTEYDAEGRRILSTDRAGRSTEFHYDDAGRLIATTFADGTSTESTYDVAGRPLTTTDEAGKVTLYGYDAAGRRLTTTDPLGRVSTVTYDAAGNERTVTDPRGRITRFFYDDLNRRIETRFADTTSEFTEYDALGRRIAKIDQAGVSTDYEYDALGRLSLVTDALDGETAYQYDELGNQTAQIDALDRVTAFTYDRAGRRIRRTLPSVAGAPGAFETFTHDLAGNLRTKTDFSGRTTEFQYDALNRVRLKRLPGGAEVSFTYTPTHRRATFTDARGTTRFTYDDRDRVRTMTYPDGRALAYTYALTGQRASLTTHIAGTSRTTAYLYDDNNRLDQVTDPNDDTYDYSYDLAGNRTELTQPNGTRTAYGYDDLNRLTALETTQTETGAVIQSYAYTLDATGIRTQIAEAGGVTRAYTYDDLYRLTGETVAGTALDYTKTFTYDPVGNRRTQTTTGFNAAAVNYTYDERDRLLTENATEYDWDANGNLLSRDGEAEYAWDAEDRLSRVTKADGTTVEHTYDPDGVRVRTVVTPSGGAPQVTNYLVDTAGALSHVVAETDASGAVTALYVRGGDQLLAVLSGGTTKYYAQDGLGSVRELTDEDGSVTDSYGYTAFGEALGWTGTDGQPYRFAGEAWDSEARLAHHRARYYAPAFGGFVSRDEHPGNIRNPSTLAGYLYSGNEPASHVDPTGLFFVESIVAAILLPSIRFIQPYLRGGGTTTGAEQLPDLSNPALTANTHSVQIRNASVGVPAAFLRLAELRFASYILSRKSYPVTGTGQRIELAMPWYSPLAAGQGAFFIKTNKFHATGSETDPNGHFFSVVTLQGHPLSGWRFWRTFRLPNGDLVAQTGAVDYPSSPSQPVSAAKARLGGDALIQATWHTMMEDFSDFAGGSAVEDGQYHNPYGTMDDKSLIPQFLPLVQ